MKTLFENELDRASTFGNDHKKFTYVMSLLRSILQYAAIGAYEKLNRIGLQLDPTDDACILYELKALYDSSFPNVLNRVIPAIRAQGHPDFCTGWFERPHGDIGQRLNT